MPDDGGTWTYRAVRPVLHDPVARREVDELGEHIIRRGGVDLNIS